MTAAATPDITVAICAYKRHDPLRAALESLSKCDAPDAAWELLVVDNGCEPAVEKLVRSFDGKMPSGATVRYEREEQLGTSNARNHAMLAARGPIVLFTDDDVTFDRAWLARMARAIAEHPSCDFWGGRVEPVWPRERTAPPRWFDVEKCPSLGDAIVRYQQGESPREWRPSDPPFYTANLALRAVAVKKAGMFDTKIGHRGNVRVGNEDSLMVRSIAGAGGTGWYAADAVVYHPVPMERLTKSYARKFAWRQGRLSVYMARRDPASGGATPRWLYRLAAEQLALSSGRWIKGVVTLNSGEAFAGQFGTVFNLSKLWNAMKRNA